MNAFLKSNLKLIILTAFGVVFFFILFRVGKIQITFDHVSFQTAYGLSSFLSVVFGPIVGGVVACGGHALNDVAQYGSPWWSWVIASGVSAFIIGLSYKKISLDKNEFKLKDCLIFNMYQIISNIIGWMIIAPLLDIIMYSEPIKQVFIEGGIAFAVNVISTGLIGSMLLKLYSVLSYKIKKYDALNIIKH